MAEQMTTIQLPGADGWMNYGKRTRANMIEEYRKIAQRDKRRAELILAAKDEDFLVEQHTGKCVKRNRVLIKA